MITPKEDNHDREGAAVLYLVVPCYNEEEALPATIIELKRRMELLIDRKLISEDSRVVLVDDGSKDRTPDIIRKAHREETLFSGIHFSRNFGHQAAVLAGYMFAASRCDCVISIDADLQQDPDAIGEFLRCYREGYDIVYGVRNSRETDGTFKKATSQMFYRLMERFDSGIIPNHADYRLLSREALEALSEYKETNVFLRGLIPTLGFSSTVVHFDVRDRQAGESKYTMSKMLKLAADGITSFSIAPMHLIFMIGVFMVIISILIMLQTVIEYFMGKTVAGWSTIVISIWGIGGLQLIAQGIIGEYVGKNYMESKKRPRYIIEAVEHKDETEKEIKDR